MSINPAARNHHSRTLAPRLILAALTLALIAGCSSEEIASLGDLADSGAAAGYNVLLVTIDTARQDRFGCYGYPRAQTPTFDALAAGGVLFEDAVSTVPLTLPSHATILTGLTPLGHGVHDNGIDALGPEPSTLPETLKKHGYDTAAFIACFVMDARFGLDRGFDVYDFEVSMAGFRPQMVDFNERPANEVTDAAIAWLDQRRQSGAEAPFFAWVHYFDPHLPYRSPLQGTPVFRGRPYDAEIAFVDQQLGRLLGNLGRHGDTARTVVIVTSDHGESLGDHREATHGMFIYNSTLKVPLVFSCPTLFDGPRHLRDRVVGLVDLRPTIEDLLGITSEDGLAGQSLLNEISADRLIYVETEGPLNMAGASPLHGLQGRDQKLIEAPIPEFYDLGEDPDELDNLYHARTAEVRPLEADLAGLLGQAESKPGAGRELSDEEIQRLRSLGYVHTPGTRDDGSLPDPKQMIDALNGSQKAEKLYAEKKYEQAAAIAREVVDQCEACMSATRVLAFSYLHLGQPEEAIAVLREFVDRSPQVYMIRSLAQALIMHQEYAAAAEVLDLYEAVDPADGRIAILRGDCFDRQGDPTRAIEMYEEARRTDPNRVGITAEQRIQRVRERLE
jgi:arylsulfatase A-like enzyme